MPPLTVTLSNASLRYGRRYLFDDFGLVLQGGKWTCLLGQSGVGKTSVLRVLAGLAGACATAETHCDDGLPLKGRIAYMAQEDLLLPWHSAVDNVTIGARLRRKLGVTDRERGKELLADLGLGGHEDDYPATLSGGMRQRVALARTLFEAKPVVVMDEPFSALDAITRYQLQELAAHRLRDRTVLLVTHDPMEALRLGHRIYVLSGLPAQLGAPLEPNQTPPRPHDDPQLMRLHAELWDRLAA